MENFYNVGGAVTSTAGAGATGSSLNSLGEIGGVVIGSLAGYFGGAEQGRKNRDLMKELGQLSLDLQKQLAERLQDAKTETERQSLAWQFLAVQNNNEMLNRVQGKRYTSYIVLGVGITILALVFLKLAKRKNG
jgi:gas vesicle protein